MAKRVNPKIEWPRQLPLEDYLAVLDTLSSFLTSDSAPQGYFRAVISDDAEVDALSLEEFRTDLSDVPEAEITDLHAKFGNDAARISLTILAPTIGHQGLKTMLLRVEGTDETQAYGLYARSKREVELRFAAIDRAKGEREQSSSGSSRPPVRPLPSAQPTSAGATWQCLQGADQPHLNRPPSVRRREAARPGRHGGKIRGSSPSLVV